MGRHRPTHAQLLWGAPLMQATAESMHAVALASMSLHGLLSAAPPPKGFPRPGMSACQTCGSACYGDQCRACWRRTSRLPHDKSACAKCGKPCQGATCRDCYLAALRVRPERGRRLPICAEPDCGKTLSSTKSARCAKHAARRRVRPEREPRVKAVRGRQCQPGNNLHALTNKDSTDTYVCTCGAFRASALAAPA